MVVPRREIPVIADSYVDREFGTGALKFFPGTTRTITRDQKLACGCRLSRSSTKPRGSTKTAGRAPVWSRFVGRVGSMRAAGLVGKEETLSVKRPPLSTRWGDYRADDFDAVVCPNRAKMGGGGAASRFAMAVCIVPKHTKYTQLIKMSKLGPISRQLWWGHRIPSGTAGCAAG